MSSTLRLCRPSAAVLAVATLALGACTGDVTPEPDGPLAESEEAITCVTLRRVVGSTVAEDAHIAFDALDPTRQNANYGGSILLNLGTLGTTTRVGLLRFDLGSIPANVPITSASLDLSVAQATGLGTASLFRVTSPWSEVSVTWSSFAAGYDPSSVLGTFQPKVALAGGGHAVIDVTGVVQAWNAGVYPNLGLAISEGSGARAALGTSEAGNPGLRPALKVCYATPTCSDGLQNGGEPAVDCGGPCAPCSNGQTCGVAADCQTGVCLAGICQSATCSDGQLDGSETGVDCGGSCSPCPAGEGCGTGADCLSAVCVSGQCQPATCSDGVQNGGEAGVDCGGGCPACPAGSACLTSADCQSGICLGGQCLAPSCFDTVQNGGETAPDCGGACPACPAGLGCGANADCQSGVCLGGQCQAPSCSDAVQNGNETATDCGGSCPACAAGATCGVAADCQSGVCAGGQCQAASCFDGFQNGAEPGVDCGGPCVACAAGAACSVAADCQSGVCAGGQCQMPTCSDTVTNGAETAVDCGGGTCPACASGAGCSAAADCQSGICQAGLCEAPTCSDLVQNGAETATDCGGSCASCPAGSGCLVDADCLTGVCAAGVCLAPSCSDGLKNQGETGVDCGGPCVACPDPSFGSVLSLLHMNGANNSTSFSDVKGNAWTTLGNAKISTAQVKFGGASGYFDGVGDAVQSPTNASWNFAGATPFTIETWVNGTGTILSSDSYGLVLSIKGGTGLYLWINGVLPWTSTGTLVGNVPSGWHHVALSYDGATYRMFVDGVQSFSVSGAMSSQTYNYLKIGDYSGGTQPYYSGYLDDFRVTKGVGRYTGNFTPPAQELANN
jgi:hypothetical protein